MKRGLLLAAFAVTALAQLAVPAHLIRRQQTTLAHGTEYRFRTAPVDPADPFRGRYVALDFEAACADTGYEPHWPVQERKWFARLARDAEGYARIEGLSRERPAAGDYIQVRSRGWSCVNGQERLELPFNRYYLPEEMAPQAEAAYLASNRRAQAASQVQVPDGEPPEHRVPAYATVRVRDGHAAFEELYLDGLPLREFLAREAAPD